MPRRLNNRAPSAHDDAGSGCGNAKAPPADAWGRWWRAPVVLLPAIFLGQGAWFIAANSQTYDEAVYACAGYSYLATGDFRLDPEHPPLMKELAALPLWLCYRLPLPADMTQAERDDQWLAGHRFLYRNAPSGPSADRVLNLARVPNLLLGTLLVGLVGLWSYRLWGRGGGLLGMALAAFDPNLVAHASLGTNDLGLAFFAFLTLYLLWRYTGKRSASWWQLMAIGVSLGLALASKFSAVSLVGILAVVAGGEMLSGNPLRLPAGVGAVGKNKRLLARLAEAGAAMGILFGLAFLVLWTSYFFHGLADCSHGLTEQFEHQQGGHPAFLMGRSSDAGWWYYFPVALSLKTPLDADSHGCKRRVLPHRQPAAVARRTLSRDSCRACVGGRDGGENQYRRPADSSRLSVVIRPRRPHGDRPHRADLDDAKPGRGAGGIERHFFAAGGAL
jgi:hypothetical protein